MDNKWKMQRKEDGFIRYIYIYPDMKIHKNRTVENMYGKGKHIALTIAFIKA